MSITFEESAAAGADRDRAAVEAAALDLVRARGSELLGVANYYADNPDDAEDAYQRALEILLTKAPCADSDVLLPWMKTVVKHEVFALHRVRSRDFPASGEALESMAGPVAGAAEDRAEARDQLRLGAEALQRLKPQETQALLLRAEGLSYSEICDRTGWTYTKVNRCLAEGRRSFLDRVRGIESGAECDRMAPLLSALADGEASPEDMVTLRPHLRACAGCRAALRDYREAPRKVAAVYGPVAVAGAGGAGSATDAAAGGAEQVAAGAAEHADGGFAALGAWVSERAGMAMLRFQSGFEAIAGSKAAVVAASTVAIAGGGAAAVEEVQSHGAPPTPAVMAEKAPAPPKVAAAPERSATRIATSYATSVRAAEPKPSSSSSRSHGRGKKRSKAASTGSAAAPTASATVPSAGGGGPAEFSPSPDPAAPQTAAPAPEAEQPEPEPVAEAPADDPGGEFGP